MQLDKKNYEVYAFAAYTNKSCFSRKEFLEDLKKAQYAKKLTKKLNDGKEINIRLLVNHVILFTNVFELSCAKELLMFNCSEEEKSMFKTILLFLGFMEKDEMPEIKWHLKVAQMLKDQNV